ncbi:hypothetical protein VRRI112168_06605 [Vreelandella rituensis]|uniref:Uncharacterized protein n=1 Tax=Vreelandella rituensis TaxID=2282306 RepID=A0A368UA02_9GAMM|nr:hypothetical protein DU506_03795 [Halomonas rituensis]
MGKVPWWESLAWKRRVAFSATALCNPGARRQAKTATSQGCKLMNATFGVIDMHMLLRIISIFFGCPRESHPMPPTLIALISQISEK